VCGKHLLRQGWLVGADAGALGKCYACSDTTFSFTHTCPAGNGSVMHTHTVPARFLPWSFEQTEAVLE